MEIMDNYMLNGNSFYIRELSHDKDNKLFDEIVEHEDKVFGEGSVGKWNIKPFAKYGKVFIVLKKGKNNCTGENCGGNRAAGKVDGLEGDNVKEEFISDELVSVIEVLRGFDMKTAYLYGVSTVTEYERQGHAGKLLAYVMNYLMKHDISKVELTVGIDNEAAKNIYKKAGFVIAEKLENEYGENIDRYLMRYSVY